MSIILGASMLGVVVAIATGYYMLGALGAHRGTQQLPNMLNQLGTYCTAQGECDGSYNCKGHGLVYSKLVHDALQRLQYTEIFTVKIFFASCLGSEF